MIRRPEASGQPIRGLAGHYSARRLQLLDLLISYAAETGLSEISLRPAAAAVGSSPRVLLYLFGSKEDLVHEVLVHSQEEPPIEHWLANEPSPAEAVTSLWKWLADPGHAGAERLFFEGLARSFHDGSGAFEGFGQASINDWLPVVRRLLGGPIGPSIEMADPLPTLVLACLRGLVIDLLATGDRHRIDQAAEALADFIGARPPSCSKTSPCT